MEKTETEIEWPSPEAMRAYAWWDSFRLKEELDSFYREAVLEEVGKLLEKARAEGRLEPRNDYQIFWEEWNGLISVSGRSVDSPGGSDCPST